MNNRVYVPIRGTKNYAFYDWEHAGTNEEDVADSVRAEAERNAEIEVICPFIRIALVEVHEVQTATTQPQQQAG